jgi:hypothetical protein
MAFSQSALQTRIELSPREMLAISEAISREFAPRFTRSDAAAPKPVTFSVRELLAISQEISREFSPRPVAQRSSLVLLPIDPRRLHAYWQLDESSLSTGLYTEPKPVVDEQKPVADEPLMLRIFKQSPPALETTDQTEAPSWFDIPIDRCQNRREVILPADMAVAGATYRAAIGISHGDHDFTTFAVSNVADIPNPRRRRDNSGLSDIIAQFILPNGHVSSSMGKAASHPEIKGSR